MSDSLTLGQWLKRRRRTLLLTQDALAQEASCSVATIKKIEAGDLVPSKHLAELLSDVLEVPPDDRADFVRFARSPDAVASANAWTTAQVKPQATQPVHAPPTSLPVHPPPMPQSSPPPPAYSRLPAELTAVIGREREIDTVLALLRRPAVRLLTLTGPAGIGKTRLSLEVANRMQGDFQDRVCFVPLAPVSDARLVVSAIAGALGVREVPQQPLLTTLQEFLHTKALLLVLDNFEQVVDAAPIVRTLLMAAPLVKALVSSREVLHLYGEQEFAVPALDVPDARHVDNVDAVVHSTAVELFVERARANRIDFDLTPDNTRAVAEICICLDGLPLAIEMAAARIKWSTPQVLLAQLSRRLEVLIDGPRDLTPRQQTLRGAISWSYDLLDASQRQLFDRLSVFVGGGSLSAIELVCGIEPNDRIAELVEEQEQVATPGAIPPRRRLYSQLLSLVEKSLVRHTLAPDGEERFWMLETMREYAGEQLARKDETSTIQERHAAYYAALVHVAGPILMGNSSQLGWINRLDRDYNNVRAALDWSIQSSPHDEQVLRFADDLYLFWNPRSAYSEGRRYLLAAAARSTAPTAIRARVLNRAGVFAQWQGDFAESMELQEQALAIQEALDDKVGISRTLQTLGMLAGMQGEYAQAGTLFERSLVLEREIDNKISIAIVLTNLALVAQREGDYPRAERLLAESLILKRELGGEMSIAVSLHGLSIVRRRLGRLDDALDLSQESLGYRADLGDKQGIVSSLEHIAFIAVDRAHYDMAASLLGHAAALRETIGYQLSADDRPEYSQYLDRLRTAIQASKFDHAWAEGQALPLAEVVGRAKQL